jgi:hypothetical protein
VICEWGRIGYGAVYAGTWLTVFVIQVNFQKSDQPLRRRRYAGASLPFLGLVSGGPPEWMPVRIGPRPPFSATLNSFLPLSSLNCRSCSVFTERLLKKRAEPLAPLVPGLHPPSWRQALPGSSLVSIPILLWPLLHCQPERPPRLAAQTFCR